MKPAAPANILSDLFHGLPQQGPGNDACTLRALDIVGELPPTPRILDVGCGSGRQTLVLARQCGGVVTAVDLDARWLAEVSQRAADADLRQCVETRCISMTELDFPEQSFDLIWSEGAIYNMGFENGLREWRELVRPGGCVAVSELSWLTDRPPPIARDFWAAGYPAMASREENVAAVARAGYQALDSFALPDTAWWDFYGPLEERIAQLRDRYSNASSGDEKPAVTTLDQVQREIDVFRASEDSYSYVFYVAHRPQ